MPERDQGSRNQQVIDEFRANGGQVSGYFAGMSLLLLTTTGTRSGQPHTTPLSYFADSGRCIVFAAAGGAGPGQRVVIAGGGFAGFHAARRLGRLAKGRLEVVLVNPTDHFLYVPLLPEVGRDLGSAYRCGAAGRDLPRGAPCPGRGHRYRRSALPSQPYDMTVAGPGQLVVPRSPFRRPLRY